MGPSHPINTTYWVVPGCLDPELAYWTLASLPLSDLGSQAAVPGIHRDAVYEQRLPDRWPPPPELVATLATIRERVAGQRRQAETLETIAETIYHGWLAGTSVKSGV